MKFLFFLASAAMAQSLVLTPSTGVVRPGATASLTVTYAAPTGAPTVSAVNWSFAPPAGITVSAPVADPGLTALGKTIYSGASITLVAGLNATVIPSGTVLAKYTLTIPANASKGQLSFSIASPIASSPTGSAVPITIAQPILVAVTSQYDISPAGGDGKVDKSDLDAAASQIVGTTPCTSADFNTDSACNAIDAQVLANNQD